jgi:hypothetical protein
MRYSVMVTLRDHHQKRYFGCNCIPATVTGHENQLPILRLTTSNDSYLCMFPQKAMPIPGMLPIWKYNHRARWGQVAIPLGLIATPADAAERPTLKPPGKSGISGIHSRYQKRGLINLMRK